MKPSLVFAILACLTVPVCAAYYEITSGYTPSLTLNNSDSLLMRGGGAGLLNLWGESSATIEGTSVLAEGSGGIWQIEIGNDSSLSMSGGEVHELGVSHNSTAVLSGGLIQQIWSYQSAWKLAGDPPVSVPNPHITIVYSGVLPTLNSTTHLLTGLWGNGDPFSIYLSGVPASSYGYSPAIENIQFQIIPEPVTVVLLGLGCLLTRRNKP